VKRLRPRAPGAPSVVFVSQLERAHAQRKILFVTRARAGPPSVDCPAVSRRVCMTL
jgi:hypothetical protein